MRALCLLGALIASLAVRRVHAKAVYAHFMVGNANNYTQADWEVDIGLAQEAHIDAFALNIANDLVGVSPALQLAFYVASRKGFKLFFSFDYAGNGPWDKGDVIGLCTSYCNNPAYLHTNGGPLLTTFEGPDNATDWHDIKTSTGCFFMPDWSSLGAKVALQQSSGVADGLFSWAGWAWGNLDMNTYTDASYWMYLKQAGSKPYMMPASPWFYTNLPGYSKNWLWRGDETWYDRWVQIIYNQPDFVEIISWNDYGESHYIGPLYDKAMEAFTIGKAPFNYAAGMPHDGWRAFLPYLIDLYKLGTATITKEGVQGWWRRAPAGACGHGDTTGNTASQLELEFAPTAILTDKIFFSALLGSAADVSVTVGGTALAAVWTWKPDDGIGIYHGSASFGSATGNVVITITRAGQTVVSVGPGSAGSIGTQSCVGGLQNWNAYVASNWASTSISKTPTRTIAQQKCINGTGYGAGFADLCAFSCKYGYCDNQACVCKAMGSPLPTPSATNPIGYPAAGLDASYSGLCNFDCAHGHCPASVCSYTQSPLVIPAVSDFSPPACTSGSAIAGSTSPLGGLCGYACNFGFCPYLVCHCDGQGALHQTPAKIKGQTGKAADGVVDHGLCSFACERGYCPAPTCVNTTATAPSQGGGGVFQEDPGWDSFTGQYCYKTKCSSSAPSYDSTWQNMAVGPFRDDCPSGQYRIILCPINETPGECRWAGTPPFCNPTCNPGEVAIATSAHGNTGTKSCVRGQQAVCCKSQTWANLLSSCSWKYDQSTCGVGQTGVASRTRKACFVQRAGECTQWWTHSDIFCCDADFPHCQWASCTSNVCGSQQIEVAKDPWGSGGWGCGGDYYGFNQGPFTTEQALCCDNPENVNPFLPVPLEYLFPTLPPDTDIPSFHFKHIESTQFPYLQVGPLEPFGMVVIDGPANLVSSMSKRDGSHVEFLDCESTRKHEMIVYKARYICTDDSDESNCEDVHLGGAEGTVVKLPEECGYATYGVVHTISESSDQHIPPARLQRLALRDVDTPPIVHELAFSYDFRNVRRASANDPVYVRIDYSSMSDWFYEVVEEPPSRKRDTVDDRKIRKRFWSKSDDVWKAKIAAVRNSTNMAEEQLLPLAKLGFSNLIYQQTSDTCAALSFKRSLPNDGFLSVSLDGWVGADLRWGYTMVGTISPSLNIEEAHGFYDAQFSSEGNLWVDGSGLLEIQGTLPMSQLFGQDGVTDYGWSQPGLVSFKPTLNLGVEMMGSGHLDAGFNITYLTLPGQSMIQTSSPNMGGFSGSVASKPGFYWGSVKASPISNDGDTSTIFGIHINPQSKMHFTVFDYAHGSKRDLDSRDFAALASAEFSVEIGHRIEVTGDGTDLYITDIYDPIVARVSSSNISPTWTNVQNYLDPAVSIEVVYNGTGMAPQVHSFPATSGPAAFTGHYMNCDGSKTMVCLPMVNLTEIDPDLRNDYDGENEAANASPMQRRMSPELTSRAILGPSWDMAEHISPREATRTRELEPRSTGAPRKVTITLRSGRSFARLSMAYYTGNGGLDLVAHNANAGFFNLLDPDNCVSAVLTSSAGPSDDQASEHFVEINIIGVLWQFILTGNVPASSRSVAYNTVLVSAMIVPEHLMDENSVFVQPWSSWDAGAPAGTHSDPSMSPEGEMWSFIGSLLHPEFMVNLQQFLNAFKSRMMRGIAGISDARWAELEWDDTSEITGYLRAIEALSELRAFPAVIAYLNHPDARGPFVASLNALNGLFLRFDAAIARNNLNNGNPIYSSFLFREGVYAIIFGRTEGSQDQYREWLWRMRENWENELANSLGIGAPSSRIDQIRSVISQIREILQTYDPVTNPNQFVISRDGLFEDPRYN